MARESFFTDMVVRGIKETRKLDYIYVVSDHYGTLVAACDKELKGRYHCFSCEKIPVLTEKEIREILKELCKSDNIYNYY